MSDETKIPTFSGFDTLETTDDFVDLIRKKQQSWSQSNSNEKSKKIEYIHKENESSNHSPPSFEFPIGSTKPGEPFFQDSPATQSSLFIGNGQSNKVSKEAAKPSSSNNLVPTQNPSTSISQGKFFSEPPPMKQTSLPNVGLGSFSSQSVLPSSVSAISLQPSQPIPASSLLPPPPLVSKISCNVTILNPVVPAIEKTRSRVLEVSSENVTPAVMRSPTQPRVDGTTKDVLVLPPAPPKATPVALLPSVSSPPSGSFFVPPPPSPLVPSDNLSSTQDKTRASESKAVSLPLNSSSMTPVSPPLQPHSPSGLRLPQDASPFVSKTNNENISSLRLIKEVNTRDSMASERYDSNKSSSPRTHSETRSSIRPMSPEGDSAVHIQTPQQPQTVTSTVSVITSATSLSTKEHPLTNRTAESTNFNDSTNNSNGQRAESSEEFSLQNLDLDNIPTLPSTNPNPETESLVGQKFAVTATSVTSQTLTSTVTRPVAVLATPTSTQETSWTYSLQSPVATSSEPKTTRLPAANTAPTPSLTSPSVLVSPVDRALRKSHPIVCFGFGGKLITMFPREKFNVVSEVQLTFQTETPKAPGRINIHNVARLLANTPFVLALSEFPGPLTNKTKQATVTKYITSRIDKDSDSNSEDSRLLWSLLKILVENFGHLSTSSNISEIGGVEEEIHKLLLSGRDSSWIQNLSMLIAPTPAKSELEMRQALVQIQDLLLWGKKDEAYKMALESQLWPHALLIARLISPETFATAIVQFVTNSLPDGSPLRTLYLLLAGKGDDSVSLKQIQSPPLYSLTSGPAVLPSLTASFHLSSDWENSLLCERWKENLAILLANRNQISSIPTLRNVSSSTLSGNVTLTTSQTQYPHQATKMQILNQSQQMMIRCGDLLWRRHNNVEAAHFCYLVAEQKFEIYDDPNARLVLIGANHRAFRRTFINLDSIQRTEIYEYAKRLGNPQYTIPPFQIYKFVYATLLADCGFLERAWEYLHAIASIIKEQKGIFRYSPVFAATFKEFQNRLEFVLAKSKVDLGSSTSSWLLRLGQTVSKGINAVINGGDEATSQDWPFAPQTNTAVSSRSFAPTLTGPNIIMRNDNSSKTILSNFVAPSARTLASSHSSYLSSERISTPFLTESTGEDTQKLTPLQTKQISASPSSNYQTSESSKQTQNDKSALDSVPVHSAAMATRSMSTSERQDSQSSKPTTKQISPTALKNYHQASHEHQNNANFSLRIRNKLKEFWPFKRTKEMKLGDSNNFYYNKELKMWVERGKENEALKAATLPPPPPPKNSSFMSANEDTSSVAPASTPALTVQSASVGFTEKNLHENSATSVQDVPSVPSLSAEAPSPPAQQSSSQQIEYSKRTRGRRKYISETNQIIDNHIATAPIVSPLFVPPSALLQSASHKTEIVSEDNVKHRLSQLSDDLRANVPPSEGTRTIQVFVPHLGEAENSSAAFNEANKLNHLTSKAEDDIGEWKPYEPPRSPEVEKEKNCRQGDNDVVSNEVESNETHNYQITTVSDFDINPEL
jgi:hypothetical protein